MSNPPQHRPSPAVPPALSDEELATCVKVLRRLGEQPALCRSADPRLTAVRTHAAQLLKALKALEKKEGRQRDRELIEATESWNARRPRAEAEFAQTVPVAGPAELHGARRCYVCKQPYTQLHPFYHALCPACGDFNLAKRSQSADLAGRVALVTGGRIRIGFQTALTLLRAGATVVATTRFPRDAALRYARTSDFDRWCDRLHVYGLDLRHLPALERFTEHLRATQSRLDVLVNNAAQTVRRPPAFYKHLLDGEAAGLAALPPAVSRLHARIPQTDAALAPYRQALPLSAALTQLPLLPEDADHDPRLFPPGEYDAAGQQVDRRTRNSWTLRPGEVSPWELVEVHVINALAPFLLLTRLEPLLRAGAAEQGSYVVNVSATEGQFAVTAKAGTHPHTSMAKASLNMITRACAEEYAGQGICMNSVDTGWVSLQQSSEGARTLEEAGFRPPLDEIDGAARICDPVFTGVNTGEKGYGKFLKNYRAVPW